MLKTEFMPENTAKVFDAIADCSGMSGFTLIGGTALALQLGHRLSEDLDFWLPGDVLNKQVINGVVNELSRQFKCVMVTPQSKISQARINGLDLLACVQDYSIGGVKVTFLAKRDHQYQHFDTMERMSWRGLSIASADMVFSMKSWLLSQRIKSRDLFDLMVLVNDGRSIEQLFKEGCAADPSYSIEYAKRVLCGVEPLDEGDEGFDSIMVSATLAEIYTFFSDAVDRYEIALASELQSGIAR